ncbi:serine/threonine-protein kinase [Actinacidiphila glaucinigra]|uniref:serine/threonine-protein kinase n=1 Tax=Actinacidiphila glaucinigra TaxID=235986 RepID=UPI0037CBC291
MRELWRGSGASSGSRGRAVVGRLRTGGLGLGGAVRSGEQVAGRYDLVERIGRGGMGEVSKAYDLESHVFVAVKLLLADVGDEEAVARFSREARIGARIRHPGVVPVYDAGQDAGQPFIVMELLEGSDLRTLLARRPGGLPLREAVDLALEVSEVLAAAHEEGVVHRDLKPANLFLEADGRVRICDFGIARTADSTSRLTVTGQAFGTPEYMAPEQWRGAHVDARCDLYAFGCVLYKLLTGSPPFSGDLHVLMHRHCGDTAPPLRSLHADVPFELDRLVAALLQKEPARRPDSAREVSAVLSRIRNLPGGTLPVAQAPGGQPVEGPLVAGLLERVRTSTDGWSLALAADLAARVSPALALELVEAAEARMWELESDPVRFMAALGELCLCWETLAPRRVSSLVAAATERFGHIEWVARRIPELLRFDLHRELAAVQRLPPGKKADQAWVSLMSRTRDNRLSMSWLNNISDPFEREQALIVIAANASDRDMDEAMRILSMLSFQWAFIQGLAAISFRRGVYWADPAGAGHFLERARKEEAAYLPESEPDQENGRTLMSSAIDRADRWIRHHARDAFSRYLRAPLDGTTARARGAAIPDPPASYEVLLKLAKECFGMPLPGPFGTELINAVSPRAPVPLELLDTITA